MDISILKYFVLLILSICALNVPRFYSQETISFNPHVTNNSKPQLKQNTENSFSVPIFNFELTQNSNVKLNSSGILTNFPFQFGFEYGTSIKLKYDNFFKFGYWVFSNLNLYRKRIFLRGEFGSLKLNEDLGETTSYVFLGFSGIPLVYKEHKLSLSFGISFYSSKTQQGMAFAGGIQYIYSINKYLSINAGIKYPSIRKARYNEYFYNPMFTIGFQLL